MGLVSHNQKITDLILWSFLPCVVNCFIPTIDCCIFKIYADVMQHEACWCHCSCGALTTLTLSHQYPPAPFRSSICPFSHHPCPTQSIVKISLFLRENGVCVWLQQPCFKRKSRVSYNQWTYFGPTSSFAMFGMTFP